MYKRLFMLTVIICMLLSINVNAKYDKMLSWGGEKQVTVDLDKDKKKENISVSYKYVSEESRTMLTINDKNVLTLKDGYSDIRIVDIFSNDNYKEIIVEMDPHAVYDYRYNVYRYKKGRLEKLCTWKGKDISIKKFISGGVKLPASGLHSFDNFKGDGTFTICFPIEDSFQLNLIFEAKCKMNKKGDVHLVKNKTYNLKMKGKWAESSSSMNLYKYARKSNNKKVYTLKKGEFFNAKRIHVTPDYTYIELATKSGKKGWTIFKSSKVKCLA